jgi:uncharacterized membrane protein
MTLLEEPSEPRRSILREYLAPASPTATTRSLDVAERGAWSLVWLGVVTGGLSVWGAWNSSPLNAVLAPMLVLIGIVGMSACWASTNIRSRSFQAATLVAVLAATAIPRAIGIHLRWFYTTDSAAFDQVAARALLHGVDPYTTSMSGAGRLLNQPSLFWTYTVTGSHVSHVSYPAGSFLVDVPALALGFHHVIVDWTDLVAWLVTGVLLFLLLPSWLRWLAGLIILTPVFAGSFSSGGTDAAFLPFLVVAVWRWDRFGEGKEAGMARWIGPVALGLACSIKQLPWFCVPFLATGVAIEAHRRGRAPQRVLVRYLLIVAAVFGAVNLPFIVWQPGAWWHGTLLPFVDPLVADGQGLVSLATHGITGGVDLSALTWAAALAYVTIFAAFVILYRQLKRVWPLLLPLAFFFSARSLANYLVDLVPVAVVALATLNTNPAHASSVFPRSIRRPRVPPALLVVLPAAGVVVASALAFSAPPLQLSVQSVARSQRSGSIGNVTVSVDNRTDGRVSPHFFVDTGNAHPSGFWTSVSGQPIVLGPHSSVTLTLRPPVNLAKPQFGALWLVEAYTTNPNSLSTSALQVWRGPTRRP